MSNLNIGDRIRVDLSRYPEEKRDHGHMKTGEIIQIHTKSQSVYVRLDEPDPAQNEIEKGYSVFMIDCQPLADQQKGNS